MRSFFIQVFRLFVVTIIVRALFACLDILDYHPEVLLKDIVVKLYPSFSSANALWIMVGVIALVVYVLELRFKLLENISFSKNVPLSEAATEAYNNLRAQGNSGHVHHADVNYRTIAKKLNYFASEIANYADIYGTPELGTTMELIKDKFHLTCDFKDRGNVLRYHGNDKNAYENCSIKRADLKKVIKVLSEWKI